MEGQPLAELRKREVHMYLLAMPCLNGQVHTYVKAKKYSHIERHTYVCTCTCMYILVRTFH